MQGALEQGDSLPLDAVYCRFILKGPAHGLTNYKDIKIICRIYWCYRLVNVVIESVMLVFSTQLCEPSLWFPSPPPFPKVNVQYVQTVCGWEGVRGC
jgi:hypothetical protein